jgi:hypothetical protein
MGNKDTKKIRTRVTEIVDSVNSPPHYTFHASGIETIQITEHMGFSLGNVIKYVMRAPYKNNQIEDLKKAQWYLNREIKRLEGK